MPAATQTEPGPQEVRSEEAHQMTRLRAIGIASALLLALVALQAQAQIIKSRTETGAVNGQIMNIDASGKMFTIQETSGANWTFTVNKDTSFMNDAKKIQFTDLKKGWTVVVNYDSNMGLKPTGNVALQVETVDTP
jgi:hypothetical protein